MKNFNLIIILSFLLNIIATADSIFLEGVNIGMSGDKLKQQRPTAVVSEVRLLPNESAPSKLDFEMIEKQSNATYYIYAIRNNIVEAIIRSEPIAVGYENKRQEILSHFEFDKTEKIARASRGLNFFPSDAHLYKSKSNDTNVYIIKNDSEMTFILFNAKVMSSSSFFVSAEQIPTLQEKTKNLRDLAKSNHQIDNQNTKEKTRSKTLQSDNQINDIHGNLTLFIILVFITCIVGVIFFNKKQK